MTSMITNNSATVALQTLRSINDQLETTNNRVSTGKKINGASDGAGYWTISTTLTSDNSALSAVSDAMALDQNAVTTASSGVEQVLTYLDTIKSSLAASVSSTADRGANQDDIDAALTNIKTAATNSVSGSAGDNWLSVDSGSTTFTEERNLLSSFSRSGETVSVGTTALDTGSFRLYDSNAAGNATSTTATSLATVATNASFTDGTNGAVTVTLSTTAADVKGFMDSVFTISYTKADGSTGNTWTGSVADIDLTDIDGSGTAATDSDVDLIQAFTKLVDATISQVTSGGSKLGSTSSRLESQQTFASSLIDLNESSIGTLVDADMEEESTRLKALQTQQSLAIQSLSIANSSSQNVLQLFQ
ncbi:flagellin [Xanthobacter agilis]|uniref:flagellin n=1 Tax=Xanthobacter agilis TaxID=47492 RepID=UPI003727F620